MDNNIINNNIIDNKIQENVKKNKCYHCNKKIGLLGFLCRCKFNFCSSHRYPNEHNCFIDYKQLNKNILEKNMKKCIGDKIQKI